MGQLRQLKKQPTAKQKKAVALMVENGGIASKAMEQAGYSKATAKTPDKLTKSQGFQTLMEEMGVTDDKLITVLDDGLKATKAIVMGIKSDESFVDIQPDHPTRHKFLETSLRLKGLGRSDDNNFTFNFIDASRERYE